MTLHPVLVGGRHHLASGQIVRCVPDQVQIIGRRDHRAPSAQVGSLLKGPSVIHVSASSNHWHQQRLASEVRGRPVAHQLTHLHS